MMAWTVLDETLYPNCGAVSPDSWPPRQHASLQHKATASDGGVPARPCLCRPARRATDSERPWGKESEFGGYLRYSLLVAAAMAKPGDVQRRPSTAWPATTNGQLQRATLSLWGVRRGGAEQRAAPPSFGGDCCFDADRRNLTALSRAATDQAA